MTAESESAGIGPRADNFLNAREQLPDGSLVKVVVLSRGRFATSEGELGTGIAVGDRQGNRMVTLPAAEAKLLEIFGEPIRKSRSKPASNQCIGGF